MEDADDIPRSRGGSTITQQTAKNLFLWPGRSFVRKALELPLALWIDLVLPKRRIMEIYLNIAEWGPNGEFGVEAGARHAFNKPAAQLIRGRGGAAGRDAAQSEAAQRQAAAVRASAASPASVQAPGGPLRPRSTPACGGRAEKGRLALAGGFLYKPGFPKVLTVRRVARRGFRGDFAMAVPKKKTSPSRRGMRRSADALKQPDLYRGQGFRRTAPPAPHRSQDRHVQGPGGAQGRRPKSEVLGRYARLGEARPCI